jgi:hypothetical protein
MNHIDWDLEQRIITTSYSLSDHEVSEAIDAFSKAKSYYGNDIKTLVPERIRLKAINGNVLHTIKNIGGVPETRDFSSTTKNTPTLRHANFESSKSHITNNNMLWIVPVCILLVAVLYASL